MSTKLRVCLGEKGIEVGSLFYEKNAGREASSFRYSQSWLDNPKSFPLAPVMPLNGSTYRVQPGGARTYPFVTPIADGCPDSWGREVARLDHPKERGPINSLDYLLGIDDRVRLGAIRLSTEDGRFIAPADEGIARSAITVTVKDLALSARAIEQKNATTKDIRRLRGVGSAMGGARPKATVADDDGELYVAKFSCAGETLATEKMEVLTQKLAMKVGLRACDARIITNKDYDPVALIRRFDRAAGGRRIPYISARTLLDTESGLGGSYTELALAIREHGDHVKTELRELFRRIAFTILVSNVDDHLLNHGFLHFAGGKWRLAPLFDVNPAPERASTLKTPISETSGHEASLEALIDVAPEFEISKSSASVSIAEMSELVSGRWRQLGAELGLTPVEIRAYTDAFEHDQARFAASLAAPRVSLDKGPSCGD